MKKTLNKIAWLCCAVIALTSCSKDDDCDANDERSACYVGLADREQLLLTEERVNGRTELTFEYDERNRLSVYQIHSKDGSGVHTARFSYNSKDLMTGVVHSNSNGTQYREDYVYGSGDRPISGTWTFPDYISTIQYSYNKNTTTETVFSSKGELLAVNTYEFDEKGENIQTIVIAGAEVWQSTQKYGDYDDKHYRFTNYPWRWKTNSMNNAESHTLISNGPGGTAVVLDQIWKYTYNQAGYPIKADLYNRGNDEIVEIREYSYIKAK